MYGYTWYKMIKKRTLYRHFALIYHKLELVKKANASLVGFASIIDRSSKNSLKIKKK